MKKAIIRSKFSESNNWLAAKLQFHPKKHIMKSINKKILLVLTFFIICGSIRGQYFDKAFRKMVEAFESRAAALYGSSSSSAQSVA